MKRKLLKRQKPIKNSIHAYRQGNCLFNCPIRACCVPDNSDEKAKTGVTHGPGGWVYKK